MLSRFSVKKPLTVLVAVVLVIVLGIVAFTRMTPDLLPNMDLPYQVIMTTYPGQTPETVEMTVTKPMEQSISVIDGVKQITSTSYDNYSLLMVEFMDGTNMDSAAIDVRSALDVLEDNWGDDVGTPYLIKVNPNILPVAMAAVEFEDKGRLEISEFTEKELLGRLEGIDGVASVTSTGILKERENILISQKKLDKLNRKISDALDLKFADAEDKIQSARDEIENGISEAESGKAVISTSVDDLADQQSDLAEQLADAQKDADDGQIKIISAKMGLLDQKSSLTSTKDQLEQNYDTLLTLKSTYSDLVEQKSSVEDKIEKLKAINTEYEEKAKEMAESEEGSEAYEAAKARIAELEVYLAAMGLSKDKLPETIATAEAGVAQIDESIEKIKSTLSSLGTDVDSLDKTLGEISSNIAVLNKGIDDIDKAVSGLDDNSVSVNQALATISQQQSSADYQLSSANAQLYAKQSEVNSAITSLDSAKSELEESEKTLGEEKSKAKKAADLNSSVTIENISTILSAQSFSMPAGYVSDENENRYLVRVGDEVKNEKELTDLALFDTKIDGIGVIKLGEVADAFVSDNSDELYAKINGEDGVVLSFSKQSDISTAEVCDNINAEIRSSQEDYEGLSFTLLYSQGDYIHIIVESVLRNLLMGAALAILLLLLFLRDIKPTLIVACSIPVSVIFAIVLMYFSGITLNVISLSGLAIGVGMLVDNSVVVIENTYRLRSMGYPAVRAAVNGAKQVAGAITASTLTTVCVFVPIVFVEGLTRQIFVDMALTVAYSLIASLIVALTLVPALSQRVLKRDIRQRKAGGGRIMKAYEKSLRFTVKHKVIAVLIAVALLISSGAFALLRGFSFMPEMSTEQVQLTVTLDNDPTFEQTVAEAEKISAAFNEREEFETVGVLLGGSEALLGLSDGSASSSAGAISAYGVLKDEYIKDGTKISKELAEELADIKGTIDTGSMSTSMSTLIGESNVQLYIFGDDLKGLRATAIDVAKKLEELDSIEEADSGTGAATPEIKVTVDKQKAAAKGLTVAQVFQQVAAAVTDEKNSTTLKLEGGKSLDVVVIKDKEKQIAPDKVGMIDLTYTDSEGSEQKTSLSSVATVSKSESMDIISRRDQKRCVTVKGTVKEGHNLTEADNAAKAMLADYRMPMGFSVEFGGSNAATMEALSQLMLMLLLGVIMIYLIMVAQFQSLKSPFIIMFTIPLAFTGGFIALLITGFDVSVVSLIGFIMLCGIIVNNGIVLVDYINQLRLGGKERVEAIVEAGKTRMRPILITALTTVLGLSLMALGIGTGAEMMQPLAVVCIGGLLYATFMTLYIIPAIYDGFNKKELRKVEDEELREIEE